MATLLLDRNITGTLLDNGVDFVRCIRCGVVKDIDVQQTGFDPNVMVKALASAGMPQLGDAHPSIRGISVRRHVIRGRSNDQADVEIYYETPQHGAALATILKVGETVMHTENAGADGYNTPLVISYKAPSGSIPLINKHTSIPRLQPLRRIRVKVSQTEEPTFDMKNAVGKVNLNIWEGLPMGYWLCEGFEFDTDNATTTWNWEATFLSRVYRNWLEFSLWRDEHGLVPENLLVGQNLAAIKTEFNREYFYGQSGVRANGCLTVGFYPMIKFDNIFGVP